MAVTTLVSRIRALTKSTTVLGISDDNVVDELSAGCKFVMAVAPKYLLSPYAEFSAITDGNGFSFGNDTVLSVERDGSDAKLLPSNQFYSEGVSDASSLFARSKLFPGVYIRGGKMYIKPDPTSGEPGSITHVKVPEILAGTFEVFGMLEDAVVHYACAQDFLALSGIFRDKAIVELDAIKDYFTTFISLIPDYSAVSSVLPQQPSLSLTAPSFTYSSPVTSPDYSTIDSKISSDDTEVASSVSQKISAQLNEYQADIQNQSTKVKTEAEEYGATIQRYANEWTAYQKEVQAIVSKYSGDIQGSVSEFQSNLSKATSYIQLAQTRIPLMNEYSNISRVNAEQSSSQFLLAYKFMEMHVVKFSGTPQEGGR